MSEVVIPKGITRQEYGRTRGWLVRVYRTLHGEQQCARRLFSDGVHGGEFEALDAAIEWQRLQRGTWPPPPKKRTAGYGYVQRTLRSYRTPAGELRTYDAFEAWFWDADERPRSTSWSIESPGEELAQARCDEWLARCRDELEGEPLAQVG
jgi:hypothetical protein